MLPRFQASREPTEVRTSLDEPSDGNRSADTSINLAWDMVWFDSNERKAICPNFRSSLMNPSQVQNLEQEIPLAALGEERSE